MTMTIVEPTDTASPEWPSLIAQRFARMTAWAVRLEATMDWRLTERARDFMWTIAARLDERGYSTIDEVPESELADFTAE